MKVKHLMMLVGLLAAVALLQGCMAKVEVSLKDISIGEDIIDDVKIEQKDSKIEQIISKTKQARAKTEQLDEFEIEINKTDYPFLETEGHFEDLIYIVGTWEKDRDCLHNIAARVLGNSERWPEIYQSNSHQIESPDLIYPGQKLIIKKL